MNLIPAPFSYFHSYDKEEETKALSLHTKLNDVLPTRLCELGVWRSHPIAGILQPSKPTMWISLQKAVSVSKASAI